MDNPSSKCNVSDVQGFFRECASLMDSDDILSSPSQLTDYQKNVGAFRRTILGVLRPQATQQVVAIIKAANLFHVPIYPISTGKNWGLGSRLPVRDHCVVVDLSTMDRIIRYSGTFGYLTIQPGVTQARVHEFLVQNDSPFFLDATGSGADTSVIGNLLERGIGYNRQRIDTLINLEVVLGTGEVLKTGLAHDARSTVKDLYRHGVGCDLSGLFLQSNFGVVVSATVELLAKGDRALTFIANFDERRLSQVVDKLRVLKQKSVLDSIVHIGNKERQRTVLGPLIWKHYKRIGKTKTKTQILAMIDSIYPSEWSLIGGVRGPDPIVKAARKCLSLELAQITRIKILTDARMKTLERFASQFPALKLPALLVSATSLRGLTKGIPTSDALDSLDWYYYDTFDNDDSRNPEDQPKAGLLYCLPICPFDGENVSKMMAVITDAFSAYHLPPAITLNTLSRHLIEAVVSIHFDRSDATETASARNLVRTLHSKLIQTGYTPYRMNIDDMHLLLDAENAFWRSVSQLKRQFDPNHIISPGRYNLV